MHKKKKTHEWLTVLWSFLQRFEQHDVCVSGFYSHATDRWGLCWRSEGPLMCVIADCCSDMPPPADGPLQEPHHAHSTDASHLKHRLQTVKY